MARGTFSSSNYLHAGVNGLGALAHGAVDITLASRIRFNAVPGSGVTARFIMGLNSTPATALGLYCADLGAGAKLTVGGRSQAGDGFNLTTASTTVTTGSWMSVVGVLRFTAKTSQLFLNGTSDGSTSGHSWGSNTFVNSAAAFNDTLGCFDSSGSITNALDGYMADVGIWTSELNADEITAYAKGQPAWRIRPQSNVWSVALVREHTSRRGPTLTQVGTVPVVEHPRIYGAP